MTPTGTLAKPSGWTVAMFCADGYDWWVNYESYRSEHIARERADTYAKYTVDRMVAVFISRADGTWQTVGTKYDIPYKLGRPLDEQYDEESR